MGLPPPSCATALCYAQDLLRYPPHKGEGGVRTASLQSSPSPLWGDQGWGCSTRAGVSLFPHPIVQVRDAFAVEHPQPFQLAEPEAQPVEQPRAFAEQERHLVEH